MEKNKDEKRLNGERRRMTKKKIQENDDKGVRE